MEDLFVADVVENRNLFCVITPPGFVGDSFGTRAMDMGCTKWHKSTNTKVGFGGSNVTKKQTRRLVLVFVWA